MAAPDEPTNAGEDREAEHPEESRPGVRGTSAEPPAREDAVNPSPDDAADPVWRAGHDRVVTHDHDQDLPGLNTWGAEAERAEVLDEDDLDESDEEPEANS
jgi:hypothetical protein